jgi:hypothetical protein
MPFYQFTTIRVKFPNGYQLSAKFSPKETIADLIKIVFDVYILNIANFLNKLANFYNLFY